jgi:hypothetical protein
MPASSGVLGFFMGGVVVGPLAIINANKAEKLVQPKPQFV